MRVFESERERAIQRQKDQEAGIAAQLRQINDRAKLHKDETDLLFKVLGLNVEQSNLVKSLFNGTAEQHI